MTIFRVTITRVTQELTLTRMAGGTIGRCKQGNHVEVSLKGGHQGQKSRPWEAACMAVRGHCQTVPKAVIGNGPGLVISQRMGGGQALKFAINPEDW